VKEKTNAYVQNMFIFCATYWTYCCGCGDSRQGVVQEY